MEDDRTYPAPSPIDCSDAADDANDIRYSLTALGEALVADRSRTRFRGFGPCSVAMLETAG